jgi:hypothetical protein
MKNFLILSLSLLIPFVAFAEPIDGASYIGMCNPKFPCDKGLKALEQEDIRAVGYLADAFGHQCSCVKQFVETPGPKYVRVHLANGTCFPERGRRCGKYDVFFKESQKSAQRKLERKDRALLRRYRASIMRTKALLGEQRDDLTLRYSLCLECKLSNKARRVLLSEALKHFPQDAIVDSPIRYKCLPGLICEKHGDSMTYAKGQRCISDLDGITLFEADIERLKKRSRQCEAVFYWTYGFNLLPYGYSGRFIVPYARKDQPDKWEFEGLEAWLAWE